MAKKNSQQYDVSVSVPRGIVTYQGQIASIDKHTFGINCRRDGSKIYENRVIPMEDVILYSGTPGNPGFVRFFSNTKIADLQGSIETRADGFIDVTTEDKGTISVRVPFVETSARIEMPDEKDLMPGKVGTVIRAKTKKKLSPKAKESSQRNLAKAKEKQKSSVKTKRGE